MIDYIRREDAITLICSTESEVAKNAPFDAEWFSRIAKRQHEIIDIIRDMPSADVTPVRHGHWIKISPAGIHECSECGKNVMTSDIEAYEYCHGCGARMDDDKWEE